MSYQFHKKDKSKKNTIYEHTLIFFSQLYTFSLFALSFHEDYCGIIEISGDKFSWIVGFLGI